MIKNLKNKQSKKKQEKTAFTLVELAVVIMIASILITGLISVSVNSINTGNVRITNERMKEIYKAIGNYLVKNQKLPCPASLIRVKSTDTDYGKEERPNISDTQICGDGSARGSYTTTTPATKFYYGAVPVKALGLGNDMAEDGFGSKFTYVVNQEMAGTYTTPVNTSTPAFGTAILSDGTNQITIQEKNGASTQTIVTDAVMAIISHGQNKFGAFNSNSNAQNNTSTDADEASNYATAFTTATATFDGTFVSYSRGSDLFDDIVFFKRRNDFVENFNAMFLMPCLSTTIPVGFTGSAYYGQIVYGAACTLPANGNKSVKCEAYGNWVIMNNCS